MNQGYLRGSATTWGHTDSPDPLEKGVTAVATGIGSSLRKSIEDDAGLVVQGVGKILNPPGIEGKMEAEYYYLPLQTPQKEHNGSIIPIRISINENRIFKDVFSLDYRDINMVDQTGITKNNMNNGKFLLLREDEEGEWNWDPSQAKLFTTALIYRVLVENMSPEKKKKYDLDSFEIVGEEEANGVLLVWFGFEVKNQPKNMKEVKP
jgi:hypothetical protein